MHRGGYFERSTTGAESGLTSRQRLHKHRFCGPLAQLVEQLTFNQWVAGSNPARLTTVFNDLATKPAAIQAWSSLFGGHMGDKWTIAWRYS